MFMIYERDINKAMDTEFVELDLVADPITLAKQF